VKWQAMVVLIFLCIVPVIASAQSSTNGQGLAKETQVRGYWIDPATGLMWAGKDNGKNVSWHKAMKYCRKLRTAGYSDWRLAKINELEGTYDKNTKSPGESPRSHWHDAMPRTFPVKGNLFLTSDQQWSSNPVIDVHGHPSNASFWYFDYQHGERRRGFEDIAEGDFMDALCVRDSTVATVLLANGDTKAVPTENQNSAQETQSSAYWVAPSTGLMWTTKDNGKDVHLDEAMNYCHNLHMAQYSDWRLATINELEAIRSSNVEPFGFASTQNDRPFAYRLPKELSLTGDPWSSSPVGNTVVWYLSVHSGTRVFDEPSYSHAKRALCVRDSKAQQAPRTGASGTNVNSSSVGSSSGDQGSAQQTQLRGYWIDPSTGLMWAARDSLGNLFVNFAAASYCHDLRLAGYSDWRLATIDELQGIYDQKAQSSGESPRARGHEPEPVLFHVKGGLFLTGKQWSSTRSNDDGERSPTWWVLDFNDGSRLQGKPGPEHTRALCVRRSGE